MKILLVSLIGASIFIAMPSLLFHWKEQNWSYIEAMYFSFVTLSTIGFGDYIAARNPDIEGLEWYRIFVVVWIFLGLAWLSSVIALIQAAITTYSAIAINHAMQPKVKTNGTGENPQGVVETSLASSNESERVQISKQENGPTNQTRHHHHSQHSSNNNRRHKMYFPEPNDYSVPIGRKSNQMATSYNEYDSASFTSLDELKPRVANNRYPTNKRPVPPPNQRNHARSTQGLVSVAAATTSQQGDKVS